MVAKRKPDSELAMRKVVMARAGGFCELTMLERRDHVIHCNRRAMPGVHHLVKRSQGGKNRGPDWMMRLCAFHHDLADNASLIQTSTSADGEVQHGRLFIRPGTFLGRMFQQHLRGPMLGKLIRRDAEAWVRAPRPGHVETTAL